MPADRLVGLDIRSRRDTAVTWPSAGDISGRLTGAPHKPVGELLITGDELLGLRFGHRCQAERSCRRSAATPICTPFHAVAYATPMVLHIHRPVQFVVDRNSIAVGKKLYHPALVRMGVDARVRIRPHQDSLYPFPEVCRPFGGDRFRITIPKTGTGFPMYCRLSPLSPRYMKGTVP